MSKNSKIDSLYDFEEPGRFCKLEDLGEIIELDWYVKSEDFFQNIIHHLDLEDDDELKQIEYWFKNDAVFLLLEGRNEVIYNKINALCIKVEFPKNLLQMDVTANPFYHWMFQQFEDAHLKRIGFETDKSAKGIHKFFLVKLDSMKCDSRYLSLMAETHNYRNRWKGIFNNTLQVIDFDFVKKMDFYCPSIEIQRNVVNNILNLKKINKEIETYLQTATLNPLASVEDTLKINEISKVAGSLSKPELIKALIEGGENDKVEFKSSFSHCIKNKTKEKYIIDEIVKTIAGFLNRDGGDLLIGVSDNGEVYGVDEELDTHYKASKDKFKQAFIHSLNTSYTASVDKFIEYEFYKFMDKSIFHVVCKPSTKRVFTNINNKPVFFYRQNPQTIKLEGDDLVEYCIKRFP